MHRWNMMKKWDEIRVAHKPITTLRRPLTNVKDKDKPEDRQGAVYKIKCCNCQASYIGETGTNLSTRLTEHKRATRNGDANNHIAEHHLQTKHQTDWDSATCITYSTDQTQPTFEILLCGLKITDSKRVYSIGRVFYSSPCKSPLSFSGGLIRNVIGFPLHKVIAVIKNESSITSFYDTINACSDFFSSLSLYGKPLWVPLVQR